MANANDPAVDSIGVDTDADERLVISWYQDILNADSRGEIIVDVKDALRFARDVVAQVSYLAESVMRDLYIGDCATCGNTRLIKTEKHGRPWDERCPDCGPRFETAGDLPRPRFGGGVR